ncbi:MAG: hypothetical protein JXQ90_21300 [Cyclobacteriaceae bacterium]
MDNGGRFYNLLTKANDGNISSAELAKVAGVFSDVQQMLLYLEMATINLDDTSKKSIVKSLSPKLQKAYQKYFPQYLSPTEANLKGDPGKNLITTGIPKFIDAKTEFQGFIFVPIVTGKTTTMMMIPIFDQYDVYELHDQDTGDEFLLAHTRSSKKLPHQKIRCAGVLKTLNTKKDENGLSRKYLETLYYSVL